MINQLIPLLMRLLVMIGFHGERHRLAELNIVKWLNRHDQIDDGSK